MAGPSPTERNQSPEYESTNNGIQIRFVNPELLRTHILTPNRLDRVSFLERRAGVRDVALGEFLLDGEVFQSVKFDAFIELDNYGPGRAPTVIVRAELQLGQHDSSLAQFQQAKIRETTDEQRYFEGIEQTFSQTPEARFYLWSQNTGRVHRDLEKDRGDLPLTVLQVWEQGTGPGSASIFLFSLPKYYEAWMHKNEAYGQRTDRQWETNLDEVDSWDFADPVGIPTHDQTRFNEAIEFYEISFSRIMDAMYRVEGKSPPNVYIEIEAPSILKDDEQITFSDIGGHQTAVASLRAIIESEKSGKQLRRRPLILLEGPPGNGKSSLIQATANELGAPLLVATTRSLPADADDSQFNKLLEAGYLQAKAAARMHGRAVYGIEGIEAMLGSSLRLHDRFLPIMDEWASDSGQDVLVIATSNFPDKLHPGITSRFEIYDIPLPNKQAIGEIISIVAGKLAKQVGRSDILGTVDLDKISERIEAAGFSGRDIAQLLESAYKARRLETQEVGHWVPIDTEFLLGRTPQTKKLGFPTD